MMFDEVTSGLDFETRQRLMDKLVTWYEEKHTTLLITSHYYTGLDNLATKMLYLWDGRAVGLRVKGRAFRKVLRKCRGDLRGYGKKDVK